MTSRALLSMVAFLLVVASCDVPPSSSEDPGLSTTTSSPDWNNSGTPRVSTYTSVPFHVAWAEQQSGVDLTPCHDDNKWSPGPDCKGFPVNPGLAAGTWATSCAGQSLAISPTCNGPDGGTINDGSVASDSGGTPGDAGADTRPDSDGPLKDAIDPTVEVASEVPAPVDTGSDASIDSQTGAASDATAGGAKDVPAINGSHMETGCSCDTMGQGSPLKVASLAALLGLFAMLGVRPRRARVRREGPRAAWFSACRRRTGR